MLGSSLNYCLSCHPLPLLNLFSSAMRNLLRCQASLRQKLLRLTSCRLSFLRFHEIGTGYSGPPPTEPYIGDYQPLFTGKKKPPAEQVIPGEVDVAIIGGGLVGLCTAFFIKHKFPRSFTMAVIEKDPLVRCQHCNICSCDS